MSVLDRVTDRLDRLQATPHCECVMCGTRYDARPLNCAACGSTTFTN